MRPFVLLFIAMGFILLLFSLKVYRDWFGEKVMRSIKEIPDRLAYMEPEERKAYRWGTTYDACLQMKGAVEKNGDTATCLLLLPPAKLLANEGLSHFIVPEPIVFYYYTGMRSKWANSPGADSCTYALIVRQKRMELARLTPELTREILTDYRKYFSR